jgi:hypothetical protein
LHNILYVEATQFVYICQKSENCAPKKEQISFYVNCTKNKKQKTLKVIFFFFQTGSYCVAPAGLNLLGTSKPPASAS